MKLTLALADYAHTADLAGGTWEGPGGEPVTVKRVTDVPSAIFRRALADDPPFDVAEMSLANVYVLADREDPRYVALPVFPSRMFRHSAFYVGDAVQRPEDLRGRRIGVVRYGMTAAVWGRALLADAYGLAAADMDWTVGETQFFAPEGIALRKAEGQAGLEALAAAGELDCLFSVTEPRAFHEGRLRRLFPDFPRAERETLRATGVLPVMHAVVVRRDLLGARPELAGWLIGRFEAAKRRAQAWIAGTDFSSLPFPLQHAWVAEVRALLGDDPWPYGLEPNRRTLETFGAHVHTQGLTRRPLAPEAVFAGG